MPSRSWSNKKKNRERMHINRANDAGESTTTGNLQSTSDSTNGNVQTQSASASGSTSNDIPSITSVFIDTTSPLRTPVDAKAPPLPSPRKERGHAIADLNRMSYQMDEMNLVDTPRSSLAPAALNTDEIETFEKNFVEDEDNEMQVEYDQAILEPSTSKRKRGRPSKQTSNNPEGRTPQSNESHSKSNASEKRSLSTPLRMVQNTRMSSRHISMIEKHMQDTMTKYMKRPWKLRTNKKKERNVDPCQPNCNCAHCFQEAKAYLAASEYIEKFPEEQWRNENLEKLHGPPKKNKCHGLSNCDQDSESASASGSVKFGCAAKSSRHFVKYYDSGSFGDRRCPFCGQGMLEGQYWRYRAGKRTICCNNGETHTIQMRNEFDERQKPPAEYKKKLIEAKDEKLKEEFLNNTLPLNNTFAFASVHSKKETRPEEVGGRMDTCKYNGEFAFCFSDLIAPTGPDGKQMTPTFAQVYTLTPAEAKKLRAEHFNTALNKQIRQEIFDTLEDLLRKSPFGRTFMTLGDKLEAAKEATGGEIPEFQIALLTNRQLRDEAIRNRADCTVIDFERADAPTANQVAVVWINEDGLAPEVKGFWLKDKAGRMSELRSGMWQIDPACFPLLHPRGTPGWRWFMPKSTFEVYLNMDKMVEDLHASRSDNPTSASGLNDDVEMDQEEIVENDPASASGLDDDVDMGDEEDELEPEMDNANDNVVVPQFEPQDKKKPMKNKSKGPEKNISQRHHARYNMAAFRGKDKNAFHWLWFARKLAEFFVISVTNRIERNELDMVKQAQERLNLREVIAKDYIDALQNNLLKQGKKLGRVFMMPSSFAGSRQYYQKAYADLMTIVRRLGNPTW